MMSFSDRTILYNGHELTFMHDILEVMETARGCLVLLKWSTNGPNKNIFLVCSDGRIDWQIQNISGVTDEHAWPYAGLFLENGVVRVYNTSGFNCCLDLATGEVKDCVFVK